MTTRKTTPSYPWDDLESSNAPGKFTSRRVNGSDNPTDKPIFWARGWDGKPTLLVEYSCKYWAPIKIPAFKIMRIEDYRNESCITLELLDTGFIDIFLKICLDIIGALQRTDSVHAREMCLLRLERWCALLQPSHSMLSPESQKGLIAELHFLQNDVIPRFSERDALEGWTGPSRAPKDFSYGQCFIEVKSKRGSSLTCITVSSEEQLNVNDTEKLFLYVEELNSAPTAFAEGFTLDDVVDDLREQIQSPIQQAFLDSELASVGYFAEDDYADYRWTLGDRSYYEVLSTFPKIGSRDCPPGVEHVSYQIDLDYCQDFEIDESAFLKTLEQHSV